MRRDTERREFFKKRERKRGRLLVFFFSKIGQGEGRVGGAKGAFGTNSTNNLRTNRVGI